jgi:hypothetical protein
MDAAVAASYSATSTSPSEIPTQSNAVQVAADAPIRLVALRTLLPCTAQILRRCLSLSTRA